MTLPQEHIKALDQLRNRLAGLSTSMQSLRSDLAPTGPQPLPSWPSLNASATLLGQNLQELSETLNAQRQLFTSLHAYPSPNFPGHKHEMFLHGLLRKKLDPKGEAWIDESLQLDRGEDAAGSLSAKDVEELWTWAPDTAHETLLKMADDLGDAYTVAEREGGIENVVTGLKRKLDDDDESGEDEDEKEDGMDEDKQPEQQAAIVKGLDPAKPIMPLDSLLKFASGGEPAAPGLKR